MAFGLIVVAVGALVIIGSFYSLSRADDTPETLLAGVGVIAGLVMLVIGGVAALYVSNSDRTARADQKFEQRATARLALTGATHLEFHKIRGDHRVVAYLARDGRSCAALEQDLNQPICVMRPKEPVWNKDLRKSLDQKLAKEKAPSG